MGVKLQPLIRSLVFHDIDEPANCMEEFYWRMVHRQLEGGTFAGELTVAQLADMQFARVTYNRGIRSWGYSPVGMVAIAVPLSVPQSLNWHGHFLAMDDVLLQKSDYGIDFLRRGAFQLALVAIDVTTLLHTAHATHQAQIEPLLFGQARVVQPDATALKQFRFFCQTLFALMPISPQWVLQPMMQTLIQQKALYLMLNLLTPDSQVPVLHPGSRFQLMKQAEDMIVANLDRPLTVHDLCTELHVSERTLRYGFQEYFGMAPMAYLKVQRLNGARRQLKISTAEQTTVTDVALQWGFWHMGQFSKDYKKMFGESPSETLRYSP